jgi:hypothetical protein
MSEMGPQFDSRWDSLDGPIGYYDRDGQRISLRQWCELLNDPDYKLIQQTRINGRWLVSTVWLGLDHSFHFREPVIPLIFETMIFDQGPGTKHPFLDLDMERYSTEAAAREGHNKMVEKFLTAQQKEKP